MQQPDRIIHLDELTVDECYELLASLTIGRVAVNVDKLGPLVVPVNFVLDGEVVVFRTDEGTKLRLLDKGPITFEVDDTALAPPTAVAIFNRVVATPVGAPGRIVPIARACGKYVDWYR